MKAKHVYIVEVTTLYKNEDCECDISQEAYDSYEKQLYFARAE